MDAGSPVNSTMVKRDLSEVRGATDLSLLIWGPSPKGQARAELARGQPKSELKPKSHRCEFRLAGHTPKSLDYSPMVRKADSHCKERLLVTTGARKLIATSRILELLARKDSAKLAAAFCDIGIFFLSFVDGS